MRRWHVESLEVVPVGLDLWALGHGVAHADEQVFELVASLGDQVQVSSLATTDHLCEVETLGLEKALAFAGPELGSPRRQRAVDACLGVLEQPTRFAPVVRFEAAKGPVTERERASLSGEVALDGIEVTDVGGAR